MPVVNQGCGFFFGADQNRDNQVMTFDIQKARATLEMRRIKREENLRTLVIKARADAECIIAMLREKYQPRRIYQWGSLLQPSRFREWSDIDIALEGLQDPLDGLRALDEASDLTSFPVDIVELERIHPLHAQTIRENGKLVYETDWRF